MKYLRNCLIKFSIITVVVVLLAVFGIFRLGVWKDYNDDSQFGFYTMERVQVGDLVVVNGKVGKVIGKKGEILRNNESGIETAEGEERMQGKSIAQCEITKDFCIWTGEGTQVESRQITGVFHSITESKASITKFVLTVAVLICFIFR